MNKLLKITSLTILMIGSMLHAMDVNQEPMDVNQELSNTVIRADLDKAVQLIKIAQLISDGADVNYREEGQNSLLMGAVMFGHYEVCELLIKHGANLNVHGANDVTPLIRAVKYGHKRICELFIAHGADVNEPGPEGRTALMFAAKDGNSEICKLLISADANVNALDDEYRTALMFAAGNGNSEICTLLIDAGADVDAISLHAKTAFMLAAENDHINISKMLIDTTLKTPINQALLDRLPIINQTVSNLIRKGKMNQARGDKIIHINQTLLNDVRLTAEQKNEVTKLLGTMKKSKVIQRDLHQMIARRLVELFKRKNMIEAQINRMQISQEAAEAQAIKQELLDYLNEQIHTLEPRIKELNK